MKLRINQLKSLGWKALKLFAVLAILGIFVFIVKSVYCNYLSRNYIEPYCAARYNHDVIEYKGCKALKPVELFEMLIEEAKKKSEYPKLPEIII